MQDLDPYRPIQVWRMWCHMRILRKSTAAQDSLRSSPWQHNATYISIPWVSGLTVLLWSGGLRGCHHDGCLWYIQELFHIGLLCSSTPRCVCLQAWLHWWLWSFLAFKSLRRDKDGEAHPCSWVRAPETWKPSLASSGARHLSRYKMTTSAMLLPSCTHEHLGLSTPG